MTLPKSPWTAGAVLALCGMFPLCGQNLPPVATNAAPASIHLLKAPGLENFFQLSGRIYSGSQPEGEAAFAELKARGIKIIISVDGAAPNAEMAGRFGLRYAHLPIGYDGVPADQALRLVKAAETLPGPIYVHCHHGLHRGPAGAAVICMATEGWTPEQAVGWLQLAGTATNYAGLYRTVEQFHPPTPEVLKSVSDNFSEKSKVSPLADVMIQVDDRFDHVKLIKQAGYAKPAAHPDLKPEEEALLLDELFKELLRSDIIEKRSEDFKAKLTEAEEASSQFHRLLLAEGMPNAKSLDAAYQRLNTACAACHKAYRN